MKKRLCCVVLSAMSSITVAQQLPSNEEIGRVIDAQKDVRALSNTVKGTAIHVDIPAMSGIFVPEVSAAPAQLPAGTAAQEKKRETSVALRPGAPSGAGTVPPHNLIRPEQPVDLEAMARNFGKPPEAASITGDAVYLFVSFSIPIDRLQSMMESAAAIGATVVFRGGADMEDLSTQRLMRKILALKLSQVPKMEIHPPLFTRFKVEVAPTWVVALNDSANTAEDGCAPPVTYAAVSGDVSGEYALRVIGSRGNAKVAQVALAVLKRK